MHCKYREVQYSQEPQDERFQAQDVASFPDSSRYFDLGGRSYISLSLMTSHIPESADCGSLLSGRLGHKNDN